MNVILPVARGALRCRFAMRRAAFMTVVARDVDVAATQWKVGQIMVERRRIEEYDIGVTAFVFGMTSRALQAFFRRQLAMKSAAIRDVIAHFRVAGVAKFVLWLFRQRCMASLTFGLDISVAFDDRPRHDQPLLEVRGM